MARSWLQPCGVLMHGCTGDNSLPEIWMRGAVERETNQAVMTL